MAHDGKRSRTPTKNLTRRRIEVLIRPVVEGHEFLSLDNKVDRETLITALVEALA